MLCPAPDRREMCVASIKPRRDAAGDGMTTTTVNTAWPAGASEMATRIRSFDWAATPLGPIVDWPPTLKPVVELMLASAQPVYIAWGPELNSLYNDGYIPIVGTKHPMALGQPARTLWAEVWDEFQPVIAATLAGQSHYFVDRPVPLAGRPGRPTSWFTFTWTPLREATGTLAGFYSAATETTEHVLATQARRENEARQAFLLTLNDALRPLADAAVIQETAMHLLGLHLGVNRAYYATVLADGDTMVTGPGYFSDLVGLPGQMRLADFGERIGTAFRAGQTLILWDVRTDLPLSGVERSSIAALQIQAAIGVPLVKHGQLVAVMAVHQAAPRDWTPAEVALVEDVAQRTWAALARARAERELRESEARFRAIVEQATDYAILTADADRRIETWSPGAAAVFGWSTEEAIGQRVDMTFTPEDRAAGAPAAEAATARREGEAPDVRWHQGRDGRRVFIEGMTYARYGTDGRFQGVFKVGQDVTERMRTETALRVSEARFRAVAHLVPDLLWSNDPNGVTDWYNQRWLEYTGQTLAEAQGYGWLDVIHPDDRAQSHARFQAAIEQGAPLVQEHRIRQAGGAYRWFLARAEPMRDEAGTIRHWFGAATDIHAERIAREDLEARVAAATVELRQLSRRLLMVQEEERRHLARELHDEIGQMLTGLQFQLSAAGGTAGPAALSEAQATLRQLTDQVRNLSSDLRPQTLDRFGLPTALQTLVGTLRTRAGLVVALSVIGLEERLPAEYEIAAYRIVQEALTNVLRHAGVREATVRVGRLEDMLAIAIQDAGRGFDGTAPARRNGLRGMQERAELLGGVFTLQTAPGAGTALSVTMPITVETGPG